MMSRIRIELDGVTAVAELKDEGAPKGTEFVLSKLPLSTRVVHATRSGNCAVVADDSLTSDAGVEGQVSMYYPNMVAYDASRGYLVFAYGQGQARSSTGTHWVTYLGDIVEGGEAFARKLQDTRDGGGALDIRIEQEG